MLTDNNYNVTSHDIVVKVEPNVSKDTFDYDLVTTQTLPQNNTLNGMKVEFDDEVDQRNEYNVAGHIIDVKVEHNLSEDLDDYNFVCGQTCSEHKTIYGIKVEYNDIINHDIAKLEDNEMECRSTDGLDAIKVNITEDHITPDHFDNVGVMCPSTLTVGTDFSSIKTENHEEINQNDTSESETNTGVQSKDVILSEDYSSGDDVQLEEIIHKAELKDTEENLFSCGSCHKTFTRKHTLAAHMRMHSGEKPFQCEVCHKGYIRKDYLKSHVKRHSGEKPFSCKVCYKAFTEKGNLTSHMRTHLAEKPFPCVLCHKKFSRKNRLTSHMRTHSGEKPFPCDTCHKTFTDKGTLTSHMRTHSGEKPFLCEVCHKTFTEKGTLTRHMRTHSGEKPFPCEICHKTFTQKCHLASHMSTHSGEKPFLCEVCNKLFCEKGNLTTHMRTHLVEKQFPCQVCQKQFTRKHRLLSHMRTHNNQFRVKFRVTNG